jgi:sugar phosphate permease
MVTRNVPPPSQRFNPLPPPPVIAILRLRSLWGATIGHFSINYVLYFVLSWLPLYLVKERGFSIVEMAQLGAVIYTLMGASNVFFGWISDRWIAGGADITLVRKTVVIAGHVGVAFCLVGAVIGDSTVAIASLLLCGLFFGTNGGALWSITQTLAGPRAAAKWVGVQNCLANFAGIIAPIVTGLVADRTGSFEDAFFITSAVAVLGAGGWLFLVGRVEPVDWSVG